MLLPRTSSQVVKPAQAGALTTPPLPESCRAASSRGLRRGRSGAWSRWPRARRSWRMFLERRDAGVPASKLRCEGLGGETQQGICYLGVQRGEQGGQRACIRLAEEGGVQGCRGDSVQEGCAILESTSEEVSTADCRRKQSGRWRLPWRLAAPRWRRLGLRAWRPAPRR